MFYDTWAINFPFWKWVKKCPKLSKNYLMFGLSTQKGLSYPASDT